MGFYLANLARSTKKETLPFHLGIVYNRKFACCTCLKTLTVMVKVVVEVHSCIINENF